MHAAICPPCRESPSRRQDGLQALLSCGLAMSVLLCSGGALASATHVPPACIGVDVPQSRIEVITRHANPVITFERSARHLRMQLAADAAVVALGMTESSTALSMEIALNAVDGAVAGIRCARPNLYVVLTHSRLEVALASELQDNACAARAVLAHEFEHVQIEQAGLESIAAELEARLERHYGGRVFAGTSDEIRRTLRQEFDGIWGPLLEQLLARTAAMHAAHDREDSRHDQTACNGDLLRLAR